MGEEGGQLSIAMMSLNKAISKLNCLNELEVYFGWRVETSLLLSLKSHGKSVKVTEMRQFKDIHFRGYNSRHSKSNPIKLNLNQRKSNSMELNPWIEFD